MPRGWPSPAEFAELLAGLTEDQQHKILRGNAEKLFGPANERGDMQSASCSSARDDPASPPLPAGGVIAALQVPGVPS